jgi:hypothetical protein
VHSAEAVTVELVLSWSPFGGREALLTGDALISLAANALAEKPDLKTPTKALLTFARQAGPIATRIADHQPRTHPRALVRPSDMRGRTITRGQT